VDEKFLPPLLEKALAFWPNAFSFRERKEGIERAEVIPSLASDGRTS
jgi:hypothetical protein